ncbi:hypothetical protein L6164_016235 [Bauhinia variegata]|uniref:Uncharacterized protein n=1 Tax=Bauhinia variegata TaxID=167791 RepID=A0ACB9NPB4_BAUVA|nr:hypothetical protein L6164_016235 [Bauhinia variegata]
MLGSLQSCEGNLLPENTKEDLFLQSVWPHSGSQECSTVEDSQKGEVARIERSVKISSSPSCTSSIKDKKSDSDCLDAVNFHCLLQSLPNTDEDTKSLHGSAFSDISEMDDVKKLSYQNELSVSASNVGYSENSHHVGDDVNCRLLTSVDNVINTDPNTCNFAYDKVDGLSSNDLMDNLPKNIAVCDSGNDGIVDKPYCKNKVSMISAILEENPETAIPVLTPGIVGSPNLEVRRNQNGPGCPQSARIHKQGSDNGLTNSDDNITLSHCGIMYDSGKLVSPSHDNMSQENFTKEMFQNSKISVGFGELGTNKINERKVRTHLDFSSSKLENISSGPKNPVSLPNVVETTLSLALKDQITPEVSNSAVQRLNFSLSGIEGVTVVHEKKRVSEDKVVIGNNCNDNQYGVSHVSEREKVRASQPNFSPCQAEFSDAIVVATSCVKVPISICDNQEHHKEGVARSSMALLSTSPSMLYPEDSSELPDDNLVGGSLDSMNTNGEIASSECLELQHPGIGSKLILEDLVIQNVQLSFPTLEAKLQVNATPNLPTNINQNNILDIENLKGEKMNIQAGEEKVVSPIRDFVQRYPSADMRCNDLGTKDDLLPEKKYSSSPTEGDGVATTSNSNDELVEAIPDVHSDMNSPGTASEEPDPKISGCQAIHDENSSGSEENKDSESMVEHGSELPACTSSSTQHIVKNMKSDHATGPSNPIMGKMPQSLQVSSKVPTLGPNLSSLELNGGKNQPGFVTSRTFQSHSSRTFSASKASTSSTHISNPRTWHRTVSNSPASQPGSKSSAGTLPPKRPISVKKGSMQNTSYIRKGNSLLRKPTPIAALPQVSPINQLPSLVLDESQKSDRTESRVDVTDQPNLLKKGVINAPFERQRTPTLSSDTKSPNHAAASLEDNRVSPLTEPLSYGCSESTLYSGKFPEISNMRNSSEDMPKCSGTPENQSVRSNEGEIQIEENDGNVSPLNTNKIVYVKRKSNQLVATSSSSDLSVSTDDKAQSAFSDSYYKRSKNQLVRTAFEGQTNQTVALPTVKSDGQGTCEVLCNRRFSKKRSHKGMYEKHIFVA